MSVAGERTGMPSHSSRRSACDRCRGQKLRCLREKKDPAGRCDRCAKADVIVCATTPVYHMRHYTSRELQSARGLETASILPTATATVSSSTNGSGIPATAPNKRRRHLNSDPRVQNPSGADSTSGPPTTLRQAPGSAPSFTTLEWPSLDAFGKPSQDTTAARAPSHVTSPEWSPVMEFTATSAPPPAQPVQPAHQHSHSRSALTLATPNWDTSNLTLDDFLATNLTDKSGLEGASANPNPNMLNVGDHSGLEPVKKSAF
ncbi:hypothetical protein F4778DRAFT_785428 [Xylariomycetidae sp. FL2044]|nr:hypothetical protein F4778DRAFT_785428 [Xylariomycetidae sp. FL2044]